MRRSSATNASWDSAEVLIVELDAITTSVSLKAPHGDADGAVKHRELRTVGPIEHAQHRRYVGAQAPRTPAKADSRLTRFAASRSAWTARASETRKELAPSAG